MPGKLFIVATPIGNLEDMSARAVRSLKEADVIYCEDTRVTAKLLNAYEIKKPLHSYHAQSKPEVLHEMIGELQGGRIIAYASDAGTPGLNDPGGKLVDAAFEAGIEVVPIPGASAVTTAISVCGFPMEKFVYRGFAPHKNKRKKFFEEIAGTSEPVIFFESTHRIDKALAQLKDVLSPNRRVFIGRELTKMHETLYRGSIDEVTAALQASSSKGEFVIILGPN
jgi:16S rRNA (cytidine1402-2'-O)-methyltransferase